MQRGDQREQEKRVTQALTDAGYIFVTLWDAGHQRSHKQVAKYVHPQTGTVVIVEPMQGGVEVYTSTPGNSLDDAIQIINERGGAWGA